MGTLTWDTSNAFATNSITTGLVTPYNLPKTINVIVKSNQKVLLGAISVDDLRSKNSPGTFSGQLIVYKSNAIISPIFVGKQPIQFKTNRPASTTPRIDLINSIVIEPEFDYRLRFVFDHSWVPRTFYCLTKIIQYDTNIDADTTISLIPEKYNGDVAENELPLILYFNKM